MRERRAYVCTDKACLAKYSGVPFRLFLTPEQPAPPKCECGKRMERQKNNPYPPPPEVAR